MEKQLPQHFLVVTFPFQGHINPALHLAKRLALHTGSHVTFSTTISAHRRMFPSLSETDSLETTDELITYIPFSDGHDDGATGGSEGFNEYMSDFDKIGSRTLSDIVGNLSSIGRQVSCIIYTLLLPWAADVARNHGISSALYWIQPATVFAIYYHCYSGYENLIISNYQDPSYLVKLPGLRPYKLKDLPNFLTQSFDEADPFHAVYLSLKQLFQSQLKQKTNNSKPIVLINTFAELEPTELATFTELEMLPIGPLLPVMIDQNGESGNGGSLFRHDEKGYLQWLDSKPEKSVVYVSFGSLAIVKKEQLEELLNGLEDSKRPYIWVVRKNNRVEGIDFECVKNGMVIEWCNQVKVLSHPSVGCFVTHCGWNSVLESLSSGVVMVGAPRMSDQTMNAKLIEEVWGVGVKAELSEDGVLESKELRRCLDVVMGDGGAAVQMRKMAVYWKEKAREATSKDNLRSSRRPVSCIISTLIPWVADVARDHGISFALYWIQPATVFAISYQYYNGYGDLIKSNNQDPSYLVELPGLRPYKVKNLPTFLTRSFDKADPFHSVYLSFSQLFQSQLKQKTNKSKPIVLINTFSELEARELDISIELEILPIGPLLPVMIDQTGESGNGGSLFTNDDTRYLQWLNSKEEKSVVYVSFGSLSIVDKEQQEELLNGLEDSGWPYIWVVRKDNRIEDIDFKCVKNGMVVEWCNQVKVLSHSSVGCFVTHCGWNSVLESLSCGVVMVCAPRISDQTMNAVLTEVWGVGVTVEYNENGVLERNELMRCLDVVMGDGGAAAQMHKMAAYWKDKAREATSKGGSSDCNLMTLVNSI